MHFTSIMKSLSTTQIKQVYHHDGPSG